METSPTGQHDLLHRLTVSVSEISETQEGGPTDIQEATSGPPPLTVFFTFISRIDNSHSYTHLILALGIVREPTVCGFITSKYIFDEK